MRLKYWELTERPFAKKSKRIPKHNYWVITTHQVISLQCRNLKRNIPGLEPRFFNWYAFSIMPDAKN